MCCSTPAGRETSASQPPRYAKPLPGIVGGRTVLAELWACATQLHDDVAELGVRRGVVHVIDQGQVDVRRE